MSTDRMNRDGICAISPCSSVNTTLDTTMENHVPQRESTACMAPRTSSSSSTAGTTHMPMKYKTWQIRFAADGWPPARGTG